MLNLNCWLNYSRSRARYWQGRTFSIVLTYSSNYGAFCQLTRELTVNSPLAPSGADALSSVGSMTKANSRVVEIWWNICTANCVSLQLIAANYNWTRQEKDFYPAYITKWIGYYRYFTEDMLYRLNVLELIVGALSPESGYRKRMLKTRINSHVGLLHKSAGLGQIAIPQLNGRDYSLVCITSCSMWTVDFNYCGWKKLLSQYLYLWWPWY